MPSNLHGMKLAATFARLMIAGKLELVSEEERQLMRDTPIADWPMDLKGKLHPWLGDWENSQELPDQSQQPPQQTSPQAASLPASPPPANLNEPPALN